MPQAPEPPADPGQLVTLKITGLAEQETSDAFNEKFGAAVKGLSFRGQGGGGSMTFTIWRVTDPQAVVSRLDFLKDVRENGRTIQAVMPPIAASARRPAGDDFVEQALFNLRSDSANKRRDAIRRLASAPPDPDRRAEAAKAIEPTLKDDDGFARADAAKALGVWGGPENTPALVAALADPAFNVYFAAFDALALRKDPASAEAVASYFGEQGKRGKVVEVLKAIGPAAEPQVLKYLNHSDVFVRMDAAKLLQAVGTRASVGPLQTLLRRTNGQGLDAMAAQETLRWLGASGTPSRRKAR